MTIIENDSPKVIYQGPFQKGQLLPLTFPYIVKTDVQMMIDDTPAEINKDFEIITEVSAEHPVAYPNSAYLKNALPNAKQITLYRVTPLDQQAAFPQNSKFRSEHIERALDKLTMQQQEQRETIARCMKASITTEEFDGAIPSPEPNKALKINSTGTGFELSEFDPDVAYRDTEIFKNQAQQAASAAEQYKNISVQQAEIATQKAEISVQQADIATRKTEEVVSSGEEALGTLNTRFNEIAAHIEQETAEVTTIAKDWATSEFMVEGIDYSAKYYAEKAKDNSGIFYDELADEDIDVEIISGGYVTKSDLELGLDRKQDKGDYALKSEIPSITHLATKDELPTQVSELENDRNYATQTQVMQAIASIPQFKLSIVDALPTTGEKMTLYLVPKEGTNNDVYDEYIWIEQTSSFEHLGTTAVDLTDYVKNTDYANSSTGGVVRIQNGSHGLMVSSYGVLTIYKATEAQITAKSSAHAPLVTKNIDLVVKTGVTTNTIELTDDEKTTACNWLGTAKTVLTTEADYNALETKDANTLYLIEE